MIDRQQKIIPVGQTSPGCEGLQITQTTFGTVVHDSRGKWLGQYETEDAAVEMLREMAKDNGGYSDEI